MVVQLYFVGRVTACADDLNVKVEYASFVGGHVQARCIGVNHDPRKLISEVAHFQHRATFRIVHYLKGDRFASGVRCGASTTRAVTQRLVKREDACVILGGCDAILQYVSPPCRGDRLASNDEVLLGLAPRQCHRVSVLRKILHGHLRFQSGREFSGGRSHHIKSDFTELLAISQRLNCVLAAAKQIEVV